MGIFSRSIDDFDWCNRIREHFNYVLVEDAPTEYPETLQIDLHEREGIEDDIFRKVSQCAFIVSSCKEALKQLKGIPSPSSDQAKEMRSDLLKGLQALVWSADDGIRWANRSVNVGMSGLVDKTGQELRKRHLKWGEEGIDRLGRSITYIKSH